MAAAVRQQGGTPRQTGQYQGRKRQHVPLLCIAVHPHMYGVSSLNVSPDFAKIIPAVLHIDVVGTWNASVFVQIHDRTVPAARFQFSAKSDQGHGPSTNRRRPVSDL